MPPDTFDGALEHGAYLASLEVPEPFPAQLAALLRSINPKSDGRLDLDKVRAIVFVIDKGSLKPGTRGRLSVDDVGVY